MTTITTSTCSPKITPCLWFNNQAEEAAKFYVSAFGKNSRIETTTYYSGEGANASGRPKGSVMTVTFRISGQQFMLLNGGPVFKFNESFSLIVNCETQKEIDSIWKKLCSGGGKAIRCGWLKDKYGISWQIVPNELGLMMMDKDPQKTDRVMAAVLKMKKLDLKVLKKAYAKK